MSSYYFLKKTILAKTCSKTYNDKLLVYYSKLENIIIVHKRLQAKILLFINYNNFHYFITQ